MPQRPCPICQSTHREAIFDRVIDDFDGTALDTRVMVACCRECGFVYNVPDFSSSALDEHYKNEAMYQTETGFGVGGTTPADMARYRRYFDLLQPYLEPRDKKVVDIGCSKGGLLAFLRDRGLKNLTGVELDPICAEYAVRNHALEVLSGSANRVPLPDSSVDVLIYSHVLEHLEHPGHILGEIRRLLKPGGVVFIEVPNALGYAEAKMFDYFHWLGMREHINHFDAAHLGMLMKTGGFRPLCYSEAVVSPYQATLSPEARHAFPMLAGIFQPVAEDHPPAGHADFRLQDAVRRYIDLQQEIADTGRDVLEKLRATGRPVYVWGIALEFFCLYSFGGLKECNIRSLIDKSGFKQKKTVNGLPIAPPETLKSAPRDAVVVITSSNHADAMQQYLTEIDFCGDAIVYK